MQELGRVAQRATAPPRQERPRLRRPETGRGEDHGHPQAERKQPSDDVRPDTRPAVRRPDSGPGRTPRPEPGAAAPVGRAGQGRSARLFVRLRRRKGPKLTTMRWLRRSCPRAGSAVSNPEPRPGRGVHSLPGGAGSASGPPRTRRCRRRAREGAVAVADAGRGSCGRRGVARHRRAGAAGRGHHRIHSDRLRSPCSATGPSTNPRGPHLA